MAARPRPGQADEASSGSRTVTVHDVPSRREERQQAQSSEDDAQQQPSAGLLRLRGGGNTRRVVWSEETVDNEGMGKKKSKSVWRWAGGRAETAAACKTRFADCLFTPVTVCCIYHKPKAFDESSDESSSGDSDASDEDDDDDDKASSDSSASSGSPGGGGVNASKSLREKRAAAADGKGKARREDNHGAKGEDDEEEQTCSHHGAHKHKRKHKRKPNRRAPAMKTDRSRQSHTVTITEPAEGNFDNGQHLKDGDDNGGPESGGEGPLPNAYERGRS